MIFYKNHKASHPLIKYIENWQAFNALSRKLWNYFLLKALGLVVLFILIVAIVQQLIQ